MELWIRSQDKMLLSKAVDIRIVIEQEGASIIDDTTSYILGMYKSEKRALEVLDEIQKAQLGNYHYRCPSNVKVSNNENTIVYEMPED